MARLQPLRAEVTIAVNGRRADARSITAVLGLGAAVGDELTITAQGADAQAALDAVLGIVTEWERRMSRLDRDAIAAALTTKLNGCAGSRTASPISSPSRAGSRSPPGPGDIDAAIARLKPAARLPLARDQRRRPVHGQPEDDRHEDRHHRPDRQGPEGSRPAAAEMTTSRRAPRYRAMGGRGAPPAPWPGTSTARGSTTSAATAGPRSVAVPRPRPDQLLIRVDAVGLCFSDVKLLRLGGDHPKLYGRDLATDPTRLGHETSVTVIEVGADLRDRFRPGQRLAIQPDIYVDGRSTAYGYTIPGGLIQYHVIGPEVLAADDGAYVVPVDDRMGYAETALTEPWACVEASYTQRRRLEPLRRRAAVGRRPGPDDDRAYGFGDGAPWRARDRRERRLARRSSPRSARPPAPATRSIERRSMRPTATGPFDDVIVLGPHEPATIAQGGGRARVPRAS